MDPQLAEQFRAAAWSARAEVALDAGGLSDPRSHDLLIAALRRDPMSLVRATAARALGQRGGPEVLEPLLLALRPRDPLRARRAATVLAAYKLGAASGDGFLSHGGLETLLTSLPETT